MERNRASRFESPKYRLSPRSGGGGGIGLTRNIRIRAARGMLCDTAKNDAIKGTHDCRQGRMDPAISSKYNFRERKYVDLHA